MLWMLIVIIGLMGFAAFRELTWISATIFRDYNYNNYIFPSVFYRFIDNKIGGEIIKGMSIAEIRKIIEKEMDETKDGVMHDALEYYLQSWFYEKDKDRPRKIKIEGYGHGIPYPVLVLNIKNGVLSDWKVHTWLDIFFPQRSRC